MKRRAPLKVKSPATLYRRGAFQAPGGARPRLWRRSGRRSSRHYIRGRLECLLNMLPKSWKLSGQDHALKTDHVSMLNEHARRSRHDDELFSRHLAALAIRNELEGDFVAFAQLAETGTLDSADMDESVLTTIVGSNESEAFFGIKPLYGSLSHGNPFLESLDMLAGFVACSRNCIREQDFYMAGHNNFSKKLCRQAANRLPQYNEIPLSYKRRKIL
jgi:hypothetical protein